MSGALRSVPSPEQGTSQRMRSNLYACICAVMHKASQHCSWQHTYPSPLHDKIRGDTARRSNEVRTAAMKSEQHQLQVSEDRQLGGIMVDDH